jgi:hypothetical protein
VVGDEVPEDGERCGPTTHACAARVAVGAAPGLPDTRPARNSFSGTISLTHNHITHDVPVPRI